jgi:hypothetical protein
VAFTEFYCQTTGSNLNAGSTTADVAAYTATNGNWSSTTGVFTPTSGNPSLSVAVGDFCSVYPDAATVGVFVARVTAVSATTITLSTTAKAGTAPTTAVTGVSLKAGGAWKGPNGAEAFPFGFVTAALTNAASNMTRVNLKGGTNYAITAAVTHSIAGPTVFQGYTTAPGDGGMATIDGGTLGTSYVLLTVSAAHIWITSLVFANNGASGNANGVAVTGARCVVDGCVFHDVRGTGLYFTGGSGVVSECEFYACNQSNTDGLAGLNAFTATCTVQRCVAHDNVGTNGDGFRGTAFVGTATFHSCIADSNGRYGFNLPGNQTSHYLHRCDVYNNGADGVRSSSDAGVITVVLENCNFVKNGGYGYNAVASFNIMQGLVRSCGFGAGTRANTSGATNAGALASVSIVGSVIYAADVTPWVDPANGDFRVNLAAARGAGRGAFTQTQAGYAGTVAYPDIGAAQHQEAASGGGGGGGGVLVSSLGSQLIKAGW